MLNRSLRYDITLEVAVPEQGCTAKADPSELELALLNLAVNARDAMPMGGKLTIKTQNVRTQETMQRGADVMPPGSYVMLEIADTGTGIPKDILDRIF